MPVSGFERPSMIPFVDGREARVLVRADKALGKVHFLAVLGATQRHVLEVEIPPILVPERSVPNESVLRPTAKETTAELYLPCGRAVQWMLGLAHEVEFGQRIDRFGVLGSTQLQWRQADAPAIAVVAAATASRSVRVRCLGEPVAIQGQHR